MTNVYCRAPWVSATFMPGGKVTPCCQWNGDHFDSIEEMTAVVGNQFLENKIPKECLNSCPTSAKSSWRHSFDQYDTDFSTNQIQFLDFRNNNLCNLRCRSCNPGFSTSWAREAKVQISKYNPLDLNTVDFTQVKQVYFAGGEPLLNPQHYDVLDILVKLPNPPSIMYSTNLTVLGYKDKNVLDYWAQLPMVNIHASIDAVGKAASAVRSDTDWDTVQQNFQLICKQPNVNVKIATVLSAINVWFLEDLYYFVKNSPSNATFEPIVVNQDLTFSLTSIPTKYRQQLIDVLNLFEKHTNVNKAIEQLSTVDNSDRWGKFIAQQLLQDKIRSEHWFDLLPIKDSVYKDILDV